MCWPGFKWNQFPKEELTVLQSGVPSVTGGGQAWV